MLVRMTSALRLLTKSSKCARTFAFISSVVRAVGMEHSSSRTFDEPSSLQADVPIRALERDDRWLPPRQGCAKIAEERLCCGRSDGPRDLRGLEFASLGPSARDDTDRGDRREQREGRAGGERRLEAVGEGGGR